MSKGNSSGFFHRPRRPCPLPGRAPPARRGWEYSLDAMSIAVRDTAYTWVVSSLACPQTFCVPVAS